MPSLSLNRANKMIRAAFTKAGELGLKPIAVCIYDSGGILKAYQAQDGTSNGRFHVASGKVRGALAVGSGSRWLQNQAVDRPHFLAGVNTVIDRGVIPVAGAVLARDRNGAVVAAVGISGDTSDNDEACAVAAVKACGLVADIG
jgi:uncharacterized protein GlcG (DUF336 family)